MSDPTAARPADPRPTGSRFIGQVAVVMGGASGIGLAIVRQLLAEGARVVAADIAPERVAALADLGPACHGIVADVTREADHVATITETITRFGRLDCAFNVAGASRPGYLVDLDESDYDSVDLCLKGVFLGLKHQARQMLKQAAPAPIQKTGAAPNASAGAIVNIASLNAHVPMHAGAAYASAKAGVEMLTRNGALELTPSGIRVNAVLPGLVQTPLTRRHFETAGVLDAFAARIPLGRAAQPEEIAGPALFLASRDASYVSGASLLVDGAWAVGGYPDMRPFRGPMKWPSNAG